jgi:hypothetical protein
MIIKDKRISSFRTSNHREVEDWRNDKSEERKGPWAVHCLEHGERRFFPAYSQAKDRAEFPETCSVCYAFDQRCTYCHSDRAEWLLDATAGFTASTGHIAGNAVCNHHQYGPIPEGVDYLGRGGNLALDQVVVEVFIGGAFAGTKVFTVSFRTGDKKFWLCMHAHPEYMTSKSATDYHRALGFALSVAFSLNERLTRSTTGSHSPGCFETWEATAARLANR